MGCSYWGIRFENAAADVNYQIQTLSIRKTNLPLPCTLLENQPFLRWKSSPIKRQPTTSHYSTPSSFSISKPPLYLVPRSLSTSTLRSDIIDTGLACLTLVRKINKHAHSKHSSTLKSVWRVSVCPHSCSCGGASEGSNVQVSIRETSACSTKKGKKTIGLMGKVQIGEISPKNFLKRGDGAAKIATPGKNGTHCGYRRIEVVGDVMFLPSLSTFVSNLP